MFGIGPLEIAIVLIVALLVFGPERLSEIAAQLGRWYRTTMQASEEISKRVRELEQEATRAMDLPEGSLRNPASLLGPIATSSTQPGDQPVSVPGIDEVVYTGTEVVHTGPEVVDSGAAAVYSTPETVASVLTPDPSPVASARTGREAVSVPERVGGEGQLPPAPAPPGTIPLSPPLPIPPEPNSHPAETP